MVSIFAAVGRLRGNRRRDSSPASARFSRWWKRDDAPDPDADDVVLAPRLVISRVLSWVVMALCAALLAVLVMSLDSYNLRTRQFQVREFEVVGNHRLSPDSVISASGVRSGSGLFGLDLEQIRLRLEGLAWIRQARVHKQLPARLILEIEEYVPVVMVAGGTMMLADDACHLIAKPERGEHQNLPVVTGISIADLRRDPPDARTLLAKRRLRRAIDMVGAWPHGDRFALGEVNWDPVRGVTLISADDGAEIRVGHAKGDELQRRFAQIHALLGELERRGHRLRYALLDDPMRPGQAVIHSVEPRRWGMPGRRLARRTREYQEGGR